MYILFSIMLIKFEFTILNDQKKTTQNEWFFNQTKLYKSNYFLKNILVKYFLPVLGSTAIEIPKWV